MNNMSKQTISANFSLERPTKNTYRFKEVPENGKPPIIETLYVQQWAIPNAKKLKVTVEVLE